MSRTGQTSRLVDCGLVALLAVLLGIPYALTKISLATIPPLTGAAARVLLAAMVLWAFVFASRSSLKALRGSTARLFVQGCICWVAPYALLAYGQASVTSAHAAILNSTTPLFVCLISLVWTRHELLTWGRLFGVLAGVAGVMLVAGTGAAGEMGQSGLGEAAIIGASVSSAAAAIHGRRFNNMPAELVAAGSLACGAAVLVPLCLCVGAPFRGVPSVASVAALFVNAIAATGLASVIYFRLLRRIGSMGTTSVSYLRPAVGVLIGCACMGESLSGTAVLGLLAILLALTGINAQGVFRKTVVVSARALPTEGAA